MALDYISLQVGFVSDFTIQIANFTVADVFASKNLFNCRINLIFDSTNSLWLGGAAQYPEHWSGSVRQKIEEAKDEMSNSVDTPLHRPG